MGFISTPVKGMNDFTPEDMRLRTHVLSLIRDNYKKFGFDEIETPCMEHIENLSGKIGGENEKLIFKVMKRGRELEKGLQTGEIAEDLTYYFATSEQIPSAVGLGVLMNKNNTVRQAGGFIIQLMPFTSDEIIEKLEKRIAEIDSVTMMLERGLTPEGILEEILGDFGLEITDKIPAAFVCDCSKERVSRALSTLSKKDLDDIINDGESIEVKCQFCNKAYEFSVEELKELRK